MNHCGRIPAVRPEPHTFTERQLTNTARGRSVSRHQKLQLVTVGVAEVDAMRIAGAAVGCDAGVFQRRFDALIIAGRELQSHVIDLAATVDFRAVFGFEQCQPLVAALEEALPGTLMIDVHAEEIDVKLL